MSFSFEGGIFVAIFAVALLVYTLIFDTFLQRGKVEAWYDLVDSRQALIGAGLAALPLLGLLGTIIGLLDTFEALSLQILDLQAMAAGGVGTALGSTQLGLLFSVPGLFLHYGLTRAAAKARLGAFCATSS